MSAYKFTFQQMKDKIDNKHNCGLFFFIIELKHNFFFHFVSGSGSGLSFSFWNRVFDRRNFFFLWVGSSFELTWNGINGFGSGTTGHAQD